MPIINGMNLEPYADLTDIRLRWYNLGGFDFTGANLKGADLTGATLIGANFTNANLENAILTRAFLTNADLTNAILTGASLPEDERMTGAILTDTVDGDFTNEVFRNTGLASADLGDLDGLDLRGANLNWYNFTNANLTGADLGDANLTGADLTDATLTNANLIGADLGGANLTNANLGYANLGDAILINADLTGAILTNADLTDADLTGAILTNADLTDAILTGTTLPSGYSLRDGELVNLDNNDLTDLDLGNLSKDLFDTPRLLTGHPAVLPTGCEMKQNWLVKTEEDSSFIALIDQLGDDYDAFIEIFPQENDLTTFLGIAAQHGGKDKIIDYVINNDRIQGFFNIDNNTMTIVTKKMELINSTEIDMFTKILNTINGEDFLKENIDNTDADGNKFIQYSKALLTPTFNEIITTNNAGHDFVDENLTGKNLSGLKIKSLEGCGYDSSNPPNFSRCDLTGCDMTKLIKLRRWEELLNTNVDDAVDAIKADEPTFTVIKVEEGSVVTEDYLLNRVRVWYNAETNLVSRVPIVG